MDQCNLVEVGVTNCMAYSENSDSCNIKLITQYSYDTLQKKRKKL